MLTLTTTSADGKALRLNATGRLSHEDYAAMIPVLDDAIARHHRISIMVDMSDLAGVDARAVFDDFAFDIRHINDFERLAVVGDKDWQAVLTRASAHLTPADMRYFNAAQAEEAWAWTASGDTPD